MTLLESDGGCPSASSAFCSSTGKMFNKLASNRHETRPKDRAASSGLFPAVLSQPHPDSLPLFNDRTHDYLCTATSFHFFLVCTGLRHQHPVFHGLTLCRTSKNLPQAPPSRRLWLGTTACQCSPSCLSHTPSCTLLPSFPPSCHRLSRRFSELFPS